MIRCINRLEEHQQGRIVVDGTELTNDLKNIEAIRREVGMVFQHFNLFPHLTVLENLTLGPTWVLKKPRAEAEATAMKYLERVRIPEQANKYRGQMSGGQQQRVAIARSLCMNPNVMQIDGPPRDGAGEPDAGADMGAEEAPRRGRGHGHEIAGARAHSRTGQQVSPPVVGRAAAARGVRAFAVHEPEDHAVR